MEQYEIRPSKFYQSLCFALEHFQIQWVYIRLRGSMGGTIKVSEDMATKKLTLRRCREGMRVIIDGEEKFLFIMTPYRKYTSLSGKKWAIAYNRIDEQGRMFAGSTGYPNSIDTYTGPDDPMLPGIESTTFRSCNSDHLIEISFVGKIPIRCLNILVNKSIPGWPYWEIDKDRCQKS